MSELYTPADLERFRGLAKYPTVIKIVDSIAANPKTVVYAQTGMAFSEYGSLFAKKFEAKKVLIVAPLWSLRRLYAGFADYECDATFMNIEKIHTVASQCFDFVFANFVRGYSGKRFAELADLAVEARNAIVRIDYVRKYPTCPLLMHPDWKLAIADENGVRFNSKSLIPEHDYV